MGKSSSPPPPDYKGAAEAQGASSQAVATQQAYANRPEQTTPWGESTWETGQGVDPGTGQSVTTWKQNQTLDPQLQAALDQQLGIQQGRSELASGFMGRVGEAYEKPFDWGGMPEAPGSMDAAQKEAYGRMEQFQAPEREAQTRGFNTQLANKGITEGSSAYDRSMRNYQDNIARQQLQNLNASFGEGRAQGGFQQQLRQQAIAEQALARGMPLNEMNALLTGQQVQNPAMPNFQSASKAAPTDYLNAANMSGTYGMDAFNIDQQNQQAAIGTGAAAAGTAAMLFAMSDRRLKTRVRRIGTHPRGVGIYAYDIFGRREVGVMAQELLEVAPELVAVHPSGFLMVNYGAL